MKTAKELLRWIDKEYGVGGTNNYEPSQISTLRDFLRIINSSAFAFTERESLREILKKYEDLSLDEQTEMNGMLGDELENKILNF